MEINGLKFQKTVVKISTLVCLFLVSLFHAQYAFSSDWPMWRCDSGRTAASPENLPDEIHLLWIRQYTPRTMVWDDPLNHDLMHYDRVFEPVVMGKTMFIGFNDADKVIALDTETGEEKWVYYTGGPVRLPPASGNGKVYVTSDDGYLYCLNAHNGSLVWKRRGGPSDRKILGNKRLISTWPARGGVVLKDGIVYWAASIWPFMGTFIYAHDAETGKVVWTNDGGGSMHMLQPHSGAWSFAGVAPQGAFVISGDKLLVPGGRSVPACFDLNTGKFLYYMLGANSKTGGSFVCALGDVFFNHHRERVTTMYDLKTGSVVARNIGQYPVLTGENNYYSGNSIRSFEAGWIQKDMQKWKESMQPNKEEWKIDGKKLKENMLWELNVDASNDLIKAGSRLYAAGNGCITAVDIPEKRRAASPSVAWTKTVEGSVERLIAADGKLFAVTLDGRIMAFGAKKTVPARILDRPLVLEPSAEMIRKARSILELTGVKEGYALFYGAGDGGLLEALVSNSELHIIAVDPDSAKVEKLRRYFDARGIYGKRIAILQGEPSTFQAPPYIASLTIINDLDLKRNKLDKEFVRRVFTSMRPYGGVLWMPFEGKMQKRWIKLVKKSKLHGAKNVKGDSFTILIREGSLPGAGEWTHNYGNIANTAKSDDRLVKLPLGLLWFGGSSNLDALPRHGHGPPEQVIGGKLFIEGMNCLSARDVYTGRVIWKVILNDLENYGVYYDHTYKDAPTSTQYNQVHIPGANARGTNYVATLEKIYIIQNNSCHVLDSETGEEITVFSLEGEEGKYPPKWGYIGVYEDLLIAGEEFVSFTDLLPGGVAPSDVQASRLSFYNFDKTSSKALIVMNRHSGKILWKTEANNGFIHNGIAVGNGKIFCLDKLPPYVEERFQRRGKTSPGAYRLLALDIRTGDIIWENKNNVFGSFLSYSGEHDILVQSTRPSGDMVVGENGKRMIAYKAGDGTVLWDKTRKYTLFPILHGDNIIIGLEKNQDYGFFNIKSGEQLYRDDPLTGKNIPWFWRRWKGCNYPIASENLLTFRSGSAGYYDLTRPGGTGNFGGFKTGCNSTLVAADGVLNSPDYTRTCSCAYQNQTSLALIHMPEVEIWTKDPMTWDGAPVKSVGINFGAPGDRLEDNGTLWLDYPSVGAESPDIPVSTIPEKPIWYRHHSSKITGSDHGWIAASGGKGIEKISLTLSQESMNGRKYTVRLFFAEPEDIKKGKRVFDVIIQGKRVLKGFDIVRKTGVPNRLIVREFKHVRVDRDITIAFKSRSHEPVISGIEIIAEDSK